MNPIIEIILKLLASSALLMLFYFVLFRGKASYRASRLFLLAVPALSLVLSLVSVERSARVLSFSSLVDDAGHAAMRETAPHDATLLDAETAIAPVLAPAPPQPLFDYPVSRDTAEEAIAAPTAVPTAALSSFKELLPLLATALYLAAMLVFATVIALQMLTLRRIRRRAEQRVILGSAVYFSREVRNAFSVMRTIYVGHDSPKEKLAIVIRHEKEHIAHRHYIDLVVMEIFTLVEWFNPFVWIARRELRNIHEFEADQCTLAGGVGMRDYMLAILEETAGFIPVMANGLQSTMIKKRFLKMKKPDKIRLRALRATLTVPFAVAIMMFFAFKPAAVEPIAVVAEPSVEEVTAEPAIEPTAEPAEPTEAAPSDLLLREDDVANEYDLVLRETPPPATFVAPEDITGQITAPQNPNQIRVTGVSTHRSAQSHILIDSATSNISVFPRDPDRDIRVIGSATTKMEPENGADSDGFFWVNGRRIEMSDEDAAAMSSLIERVKINNNEILKILDRQPMAPEIEAKVNPLQQAVGQLTDSIGKIQLKYFPLVARAVMEDRPAPQPAQQLKEPPHYASDFPAGFDFADRNLSVGPDGIVLDADGRQIPIIDHFIEHDGVAVSADKQVIIKQHPGNPFKLLRIERGNHETRVTFALNIYWSGNWLVVAKDACLVDPKTGDRYMIRGIANSDEQLGRLGWIYGLQGKAIERTLIFPPLPPNLKVVDYDDGDLEDGILPDPTNSVPGSMKKIRIDDYDPQIQAEKAARARRGRIIR